ncbi:translocation/assembly module TamB domain-containing protein [Novilysobacter erysipheiresistens]|uniref:Translocation/assembly module TamB domain-containing protein n=1 Tax=Novilysobacter erysipheiresistens TaxID=1749332 RepID=A0ABU7YYE4_9GAMM
MAPTLRQLRFRRRHIDPTLTPEEREERIKELRRKREARLRVLAVRSVLLAGGLVLALVLLGYWLLTTIGGRDFLLAQIVARLPADAELSWSRAEGPASGPLTLHDVRFTLPRQRDPDCVATATTTCAMGTIVFTAREATVDPAIRPLLGRRLRLDALQITDATLDLPASDTPFELPSWPDSLPQISPPLALQADDLRIDGFRVSSAGEPLIDIAHLRGGLVADDGELHIERLRVDSDRGRFSVHGDYAPGDNYRTDLVATAVLPAAAARTPARLGFVARGDLARMDVALAGNAPGPLRATLVLRENEDDADRPRWQLRAQADSLDPGLLTDPGAAPTDTPLSLQVQADGVGGAATLSGRMQQSEFSAQVLPSQVRIEDQVLQVDPLQLQLFDGRVRLRGHADFTDPGNATFRFAANARDLQWGGGAAGASGTPTPIIEADADLGLAGTMRAWALFGRATLARDGEQAELSLDGRGNAERLQLKTLHVQMPTGTLDATGAVAWAPARGWDIDARLAGFDPGYFAAGWDGAVNGDITSTGQTRVDGGLDITADVTDLGGRLRGRPLDGNARFAMHGAAPVGGTTVYEGEVALSLGGSRIDAEGRVNDRLDIDARFAPLQLADLLPDSAGTLRGTLRLQGPSGAPDIAADLDGSGLRYGDYSADTLAIDGELPWARGDGAMTVRASNLVAGIAFDRLDIDARGAVEDLRVDAQAQGEVGRLDLAGNLDRQGNRWSGTIASLQLAPQRGADWQLQQPAAFSWATGRATLDDFCLASSAGGSLCADADWPRRSVTINGDGLPLSLASAYLPERDGRPWLLRGELAIDAQLRPQGNGWVGQARIASASGGLKFSERARRELIRYDDLLLEANFRPQGIDATLATVFNDDGRLDARITTGWDAYAPLDGEIAFDTDELTWMEMFSPDIVEPTGRLSGRIALGGTRAQPRLGGQAQLANFETGIPSLAIALHDGNLQLNALPDGSARISGSVRSSSAAGNSDGGVLNIDGSLGWRGEETPLVLNLRGTEVLVSDTPDLRAVASPDLQISYRAGEPLRLTGEVAVPEARINLEGLEGGVSTSPDVVVLDPVDPEAGPGTPLAMDLVIIVGDDVRMNGFGLTGSLDGRLHIVARPGREMIATGNLEVGGEYTAYGQDLTITRGHLSWSSDPIGDPIIDLRAEREIGEVTAGVDVSGRASAPQAEVWSNPASSQSEALAYLTLGRPLSSLSGSERGELNAASAALTAGGSLLAGQLGAKIGLDDAGVMQSRALGGSVFGVGKQISPRLYVGYGVSLLGTGTVLTLKYLLDHGFDIEIESSSIENRGSINWRKEK